MEVRVLRREGGNNKSGEKEEDEKVVPSRVAIRVMPKKEEEEEEDSTVVTSSEVQLPCENAFTLIQGHDFALNEVRSVVLDGNSFFLVCCVVGCKGVGKSSLANYIAHSLGIREAEPFGNSSNHSLSKTSSSNSIRLVITRERQFVLMFSPLFDVKHFPHRRHPGNRTGSSGTAYIAAYKQMILAFYLCHVVVWKLEFGEFSGSDIRFLKNCFLLLEALIAQSQVPRPSSRLTLILFLNPSFFSRDEKNNLRVLESRLEMGIQKAVSLEWLSLRICIHFSNEEVVRCVSDERLRNGKQFVSEKEWSMIGSRVWDATSCSRLFREFCDKEPR